MENSETNISVKYVILHKYLLLAVSCIFLCFTICIFAPFEMYIGNIAEFWFSVKMFWWIPLLIGIGMAMLTFTVGILLRGTARAAYTGAIFGIGLAVYIQGNFMNINTGRLDGSEIDWSVYKANFIVNGIIWLVCILAPIILTLVFKNKSAKPILAIAALLILMQAAALGVLFITANWSQSHKSEGYLSAKGLYEIGSKQNVVVLIMDMYDDLYFKKLLKEKPELAEEFDGFTLFTNNTGAYFTTLYAVPGIISGGQLLNFAPFDEMLRKNFEKNDYWKKLKENGFSYKIYSTEMSLPVSMHHNVDNYIGETLGISDYVEFTKLLYRLVAYKYLPNCTKPYTWMDGTEFNSLRSSDDYTDVPYDMSNTFFRDGIAEKGISIGECESSISFIHTQGAHYPYKLDAQGNDSAIELTDMDAAQGALKIAMQYIDGIKMAGRLDNTTVILTADHGCAIYGAYKSLFICPLMLIKPAGATGEMKISNAPVSTNDIIPTIMSCTGLNDDNKYGKSMFDYREGDVRERTFYTYTFEDITEDKPNISTLYEYKIKPENNDKDSFYSTGIKYDKNGKKQKWQPTE